MTDLFAVKPKPYKPGTGKYRLIMCLSRNGWHVTLADLRRYGLEVSYTKRMSEIRRATGTPGCIVPLGPRELVIFTVPPVYRPMLRNLIPGEESNV